MPVNWYKIGQLLSVFIGGMTGGAGRYEVGKWLGSSHSLLATTSVNLIGCYLLVFTIYGLDLHVDLPEWLILGLETGIVGSFTTFSTFGVQFVQTATTHLAIAILYLTVNLVGGFFMAMLGFGTAHVIDWRQKI